MPAIIAGRSIQDYARTGEQVPAGFQVTTCFMCDQPIALSPSAQEWLIAHTPAETVCSPCAILACNLMAGSVELTMTSNCAAQVALYPELKEILSELLNVASDGSR